MANPSRYPLLACARIQTSPGSPSSADSDWKVNAGRRAWPVTLMDSATDRTEEAAFVRRGLAAC